MVENLHLLFQDVNMVNINCFGSLQDWIHEAFDKQYWNQLVTHLLHPSMPLPELDRPFCTIIVDAVKVMQHCAWRPILGRRARLDI